jgi:hypothetical protein
MSPRIALPAFLAASALIVLSACSTGRVNYVYIDSSYSPTEYSQLPFTGPLTAEVSGNPFNIPQEQLTQIVNQSIQPSATAKNTNARWGARVHIAFGVPATDVNSACQEAGYPGQANGRITMSAALCRGKTSTLSYLTASIGDVTGPDDPRFKAWLRQSIVQLFPASTDETPDHNNCAFPAC